MPRALAAWLLLLIARDAWCDDAKQKDVGTSWTWLTDYAYATAEWTLNTEDGCSVEVGTGIKAFGKPRGSVHTFTGHYRFTTWGIGAIHVRSARGSTVCRVRLDQGDVGAITVYRGDF